MEFKQLLYFVTVSKLGSVNQAAESLFTSQPSVSKSLRSLEEELGIQLFHRTNKGMEVTQEGHQILIYAENVLKNLEIMQCLTKNKAKEVFGVASYPSKMMAKIFTDLYLEFPQETLDMHFFEGSTEAIIESVAKREAEIGIVYVSGNQMKTFRHMLGVNKLDFFPVSMHEPCIYVGVNHPFYDREKVSKEEVLGLKFIQYRQDYFLMDEYLETIDSEFSEFSSLNQVVVTDSNHVMLKLLWQSDLCYFGLHFFDAEPEAGGLKAVAIENAQASISLGYVCRKEETLSGYGQEFVERMYGIIQETRGGISRRECRLYPQN